MVADESDNDGNASNDGEPSEEGAIVDAKESLPPVGENRTFFDSEEENKGGAIGASQRRMEQRCIQRPGGAT